MIKKKKWIDEELKIEFMRNKINLINERNANFDSFRKIFKRKNIKEHTLLKTK